MGSNKEAVIIGGGVIGLACAHYLTESGISVRVLDKGKIGQGASHGNCGLLYFSDVIPLCAPGAVSKELIRTLKGTSPLYIKPEPDIAKFIWLAKFALQCRPSHKTRASNAKYELLTYSLELFKSFLGSAGLACDFEDKGLLSVFKKEKNFEAYGETQAFLADYGLQAERIEKDQLSETEPALRDDVAGAWLNKADWHLRPELLMAAWHKMLKAKGVVFNENCNVLDLGVRQGTVTRVVTDQGTFTADNVILAAGAWTPLITQKLNLKLPVLPGKGYSITMERPGLCPSCPCLLYEKNMVVTPWKSAYRLGGTMEFSGYSSSINRQRLDKLIKGADLYLKEPLGNPLIEEWTSLRPMTYDDMPVIDRPHRMKNLVIATGHGMLGLTLATGTGKIVNDLILGRRPRIDITPYSLNRF